MAIRLPVVLSQNSIRSLRVSEIEEEWIALLLLEARLDAALIGALESLSTRLTDRLCLEGIKGDFLLLSWLSSDEIMPLLTQVEIGPFELISVLDGGKLLSDVGGQRKRKKVYSIRLSPDLAPSDGVATIRETIASLSTPVFQLGQSQTLAATNPRRADLKVTPIPTPSEDEIRPKVVQAPFIQGASRDSDGSNGKQFSETAQSTSTESGKISNNIEPEFPNIDRLVDDLDSWDL